MHHLYITLHYLYEENLFVKGYKSYKHFEYNLYSTVIVKKLHSMKEHVWLFL